MFADAASEFLRSRRVAQLYAGDFGAARTEVDVSVIKARQNGVPAGVDLLRVSADIFLNFRIGADSANAWARDGDGFGGGMRLVHGPNAAVKNYEVSGRRILRVEHGLQE